MEKLCRSRCCFALPRARTCSFDSSCERDRRGQHSISIFFSLLIGAFNGFCISRLGLPAFIATLSTLAMGRGLTLALSNDQTVFGLPDSFSFFGGGTLFGISVPIIATVIVFTIMHFVLAHTVFGPKCTRSVETAKQRVLRWRFSFRRKRKHDRNMFRDSDHRRAEK